MTEKENIASEGNLDTHRALLTQKTQPFDPKECDDFSAAVKDGQNVSAEEIQLDKPDRGKKELAYLEQPLKLKDKQTDQVQNTTPPDSDGAKSTQIKDPQPHGPAAAQSQTAQGPPKGAGIPGKGGPGGGPPGRGPGGGPPGRGRPAQGPRVSYMQLYKYSPKWDKFVVRMGLIFSIGSGACSPMYAIIIGRIVELFDPQLDSETKQGMLHEFLWIIIAIATAIYFTSFLGYSMMQISAERVSFKLRARYLASLMKQEISYFEAKQVEAMPSKMAEYFVKISDGSGEKTGQLFGTIGASLSGIIIGLTVCPYYSLALLAYMPFATLLMKCLGKTIMKSVISKMRCNGELGAFTEEMLSSLKLIVSFGKEQKKLDEYKDKAFKAYSQAKKSAISTGIAGGFFFGLIVGFSCYSWAVGYAFIKYDVWNPIQDRPVTVPDIVTSYQALMFGMFSIMSIQNLLPAVFTALAVGHEVITLIDRKPEITSKPDSVCKFEIEDGIQFNTMQFRYPTAAEHVGDVFQGVTFLIKSGTTTAIVGPSGSGKSTLVQMINRFYDPKAGSIKYGSTDLKDINLKSLRESIGYVGQEPVLIVGTIKENLMYGNKDASQEDLNRAIKLANADFIYMMEKGLDTYVGSSTVLNLSGGQKQRIAIARALIKRPQILVLDEATSALDPKSEGEVQAAILNVQKEQKGQLTIIMIAHRLQTIMSAQNLLYIENPRSVRAGEKGTKEYAQIMDRLKKTNYAHQVGSDSDSDSEEDDRDAHAAGTNAEKKSNQLLNVETSRVSHQSHYSQNSMQMNEESKQESKIIKKELQRAQKLTAEQKAAEEKKKAAENKITYRTSYESTNAGWCRILSYYKPHCAIVCMILTAIVNSMAMPVIAWFVIRLQFAFFSKSEGNSDWQDESTRWLLMMFGWIFVLVSFRGLEKSIFSVMGEKMTFLLRIKLIEEILHKQISWFDREDRAPGIITKTISGDVALLNGMTAEMLVTLFELVFVMLLGLVAGIYFSWQASIVCMICSPVMLIGMYMQATMKWGRKEGKQAGNEDKISNYEKSNALLSDVIINYRTVISFGQKNVDSICDKFEQLLEGPMQDVIKKSNKAGAYYGLGQSGRTIYISLVFIINIEFLIAKWGLDGTDVFTSTYLLFFTYMSLGAQAANVPSITKAKQAAKPIFSIIDEPSELDIREKSEQNSLKVVQTGRIEFKEVTFNYPTRAQKVMDHFNLEIPAGAKIALVGHSGCGKSTLTNILLRFYNIEEGCGEILIDDQRIERYDAHALREQCGYVMQEPVLFNASIKNNILFGKPDATDEEIYIAAQKANALQFIEADQDDLTPEQVREKLDQNLRQAFEGMQKMNPNFSTLYSEVIKDSTQFLKQIMLDMINSIDGELFSMIETNTGLFKASVETISKKYGASWADLIIHFEWTIQLQGLIADGSSFTEEFQKLVTDTMSEHPELQGCCPVNKISEASTKGYRSTFELAAYLELTVTEYKMSFVKTRFSQLMYMAVDRKRNTTTGKFDLHIGFSKECGLKGGKLSGGQKQRVAIARALIKDPRILILDEATSALDEHSQEVVQQALDRAMEGRTSIVIAHRLSTIRNCDILFVLGNGHVLEYGTYDELADDPDSHFNVLKAGMEN